MGNYQRRAWLSAIKENTGRHMLDSGGAYGRHWERNASLELESAYSWTHRLKCDKWGWEVSLNVLQYLEANYIIDRSRTARFHRFAFSESQRDNSWNESLYDFVRSRSGHMYNGGSNTYNGESLLTQCVLEWYFTDADETDWIAVSTHNGCDVRGGYSRPFLCRKDECEYEMGAADGWMACDNGHSFYTDDSWHWYDGDTGREKFTPDSLKVRSNGRGFWLPCPKCGRKLSTD